LGFGPACFDAFLFPFFGCCFFAGFFSFAAFFFFFFGFFFGDFGAGIAISSS
jgi:hypothetical protein